VRHARSSLRTHGDVAVGVPGSHEEGAETARGHDSFRYEQPLVTVVVSVGRGMRCTDALDSALTHDSDGVIFCPGLRFFTLDGLWLDVYLVPMLYLSEGMVRVLLFYE